MASGTAVAPIKTSVPVVVAPPLRVSFSWTLAGNIVYAATQFGMISVLAKLGNASIVGQYALALAISAPVFMLTNLQLRAVQATDARNEFEFADYLALRAIATVLGMSVVFGIVVFSRYDVATKTVIVLVTMAKAIETIGDVIAGQLQKFECLDKVARALMLRGIASLATFATAFWLTRNLATAIYSQAATWTATIALYDFRIVSRLLGARPRFFNFCSKTLKSLILISWPLGLVMTLISLNVNIPRYILERKLGTAGLGIFASCAYLLTAMALIVVALGQSVCTRMSKQFAAGDVAGFKALLTKLLLFAAALGLVGLGVTLVAGRQILTIVYRSQYAEHVDLLLVMVGTATISSMASFMGFAMTAARCFRRQIPVMAATVVTTFVLALALVPRFGLMGAGYALFIAAAVQSVASYLVLNAAIRRRG